ncbi:prepilin-type N-terminal cleavage/methylation domain-containing protein [Paucibacter sp. O1-1]|nr:prepilin-type N-terminal cleavage/methylation domain-containing protein [Paucibacter sp. O1-1]MDA3830405.1 prepilin-type N-terminal cleavage/methylation domain-containing protein [Paucibacter sp. O1-1]
MLNPSSSRLQHGLSLIEMMVGLTIGMIVVAGASLMTVAQLEDHRRLMLETQVQQDLRAAADLVLRDMRRAGFNRRAEDGVSAPGAAAKANLYAMASLDKDGQLLYSYSRAKGEADEDGEVANNEEFGYRVRSKELQFRHGGNWQPLTDPKTLEITSFEPQLLVQRVKLDEFCQRPCPAGATDCPPSMEVRELRLTLSGKAAHDARVVRSVTVSTRLRNDAIEGGC